VCDAAKFVSIKYFASISILKKAGSIANIIYVYFAQHNYLEVIKSISSHAKYLEDSELLLGKRNWGVGVKDKFVWGCKHAQSAN